MSTSSTPTAHESIAQAAVELREVSFAYSSRSTPVLEHISLRIEPGERLGILGPNGAGKTTLVKLILGMLKPSAGSISVFGQLPEHARTRRWIGYVPQRPTAELSFPLSVRQVVAMPATIDLLPWQHEDARRREAVDRALSLTGANAFAHKPIGRLSGGQLQRTFIARALAGNPRILLLDEPTVGIDVAGQQQFARLLEHVQASLGITVIVVTHDLRTVAAGCDRIACLHRTLHAHTSPAGLSPEVLAEVFRHEVEGIFGDVHIDAHRAEDCRDPSHMHAQGHDQDHPHNHGHQAADQASQGGGDANA